MGYRLWVAVFLFCGCGPSQSAPAPAIGGEPAVAASPAAEPLEIADAAAEETQAVDAGVALPTPGPADASPPAVDVELLRSKRWPFYRWDKAQSYTFNLRPPGPRAKLRAYSKSQGWSDERNPGPELTEAQAKKALQLLSKTQGELIVSKCPFPRHGIVFFQGEVPVGSISVCFECGDIMIWPAYSEAPGWEDQKSRRMGKLMKAYDRVFPQWETLFQSDLGLPTDWTRLPPTQTE